MKWVGLLWLLSYNIVSSVSNNDDKEDDKDMQKDLCLPRLADDCFTDLYEDFSCRLDAKTKNEVDCKKRDVKDLCSLSKEALDCSEDIIDSFCTAENGTINFGAWMQGLYGVYNSFCIEDIQKIRVLLTNPRCWNIIKFLKCVEVEAHVEHVVDLLHSELDLNKCSELLIAMAICNSKATNAGHSCAPAQQVINGALHAFFTQTRCGKDYYCSSASHSSLQKWHCYFVLYIILGIFAVLTSDALSL